MIFSLWVPNSAVSLSGGLDDVHAHDERNGWESKVHVVVATQSSFSTNSISSAQQYSH